MTAVPDIYKNVNISDGQVIVTADMNGFVRYQQAKITDQIIEKMIGGLVGTIAADVPDLDFPGSMNGTDVPTGLAYALTVGGACPAQGSTNAKIKITPGTLFQKIGSANGDDSTLLAFTFDGTEFVTIANGDPANPRIDLVEMKLELIDTLDPASRDVEDAVTDAPSSQTVNTTHRVQMTLQVKAGTAGATPAWPAPDTGFVPICAVLVGTNYVAASAFEYIDDSGTIAVIHDLRMPVNVQPFFVAPPQMIYDTGSNQWTNSATRDFATAGTSAHTEPFRIPCPVTKGRIVAVSIVTKGANGCDAHLAARNIPFGGGIGDLNLCTLRGIMDTTTDIHEQQNTFRYWDVAVSGGPSPAANHGLYNIPVWAQGKRCPTETFKNGIGDGLNALGQASSSELVVLNAPTGMVIYGARFWVAMGL